MVVGEEMGGWGVGGKDGGGVREGEGENKGW